MEDEQAGVDPAAQRGRDADYRRLLEEFGAEHRPARECVKFLLSQGYSSGQARNAVYRFKERSRRQQGAREGPRGTP